MLGVWGWVGGGGWVGCVGCVCGVLGVCGVCGVCWGCGGGLTTDLRTCRQTSEIGTRRGRGGAAGKDYLGGGDREVVCERGVGGCW